MISSAAARAFCVSSSRTRAAAARGSFVRFVGLQFGLFNGSLRGRLVPGEFRFVLLRVGQSFRDAVPGLLDGIQNRFVGEEVQSASDEEEPDRWSDKMGKSTPK